MSATLSDRGTLEPLQQTQWALVERMAASAQLRRSNRLREFLLYVGHQAIFEGATELHEQTIGEAVFGRSPGYDTSLDNIVRVNATEIRKRIESYFADEGMGEPLVLEIPRGSYLPVFHQRGLNAADPLAPPVTEPIVEAALVAESTSAASANPPRSQPAPWPWYAMTVVLIAAVAALGWYAHNLERRLEPWRDTPTLEAFWRPLLGSGSQTDVLLADTSFALVEDISGKSVPLNGYLDYSYQRLGDAPGISADTRAALNLVVQRNNGSFGDFRVAQQILALAPGSAILRMQFARDYTPEAIKRNNVVLIGSRKSNPWVDLFEGQLNFALGYDPAAGQSYVWNRKPAAGEAAKYLAAPAEHGGGDGYSLIARLPNVTAGSSVLILEGTDSQATNAAGEFVTSEASLADLQRRAGGVLPASFEVLLRTSHLSTTPMRAQVVAIRVPAR